MKFHDIVLLSSLLPCVSAFVPTPPLRYSPGIRPPTPGTRMAEETVLQDMKMPWDNSDDKPKPPKKVLGGEFIDSDALLAKSTFAIKPNDLIQLTYDVLAKGAGTEDPDVLADDFEFCAPVVGPLPKEDYVGALKTFKLLDAFPDLNSRFYNIHVDPFETNRVWWFTRPLATNTGPILGKEPTGIKLELPPQANSFTFNEAGKVTQITVGYVLDRRVGNTGGLGGAFGYFYGTGNPLPIPECQPYQKSLQFQLLGLAGDVAKKFAKKEEPAEEPAVTV